MNDKYNALQRQALSFIILMGVVSLFSDMTYEGARSLTGPYLGLLGASAFVVGLVSGLGEFIGYALRLLTGIIADKTKNYWLLTIIGYALNLLAVPLLALTGNWPLAAALIVAERLGKAIRKPARDAMMSHAASQVGVGYGFALEEFLDQLGAILGPLFLALVIYLNRGAGQLTSYRRAFAFLLIPALAAMIVLFISRLKYPAPQEFEATKSQPTSRQKFDHNFVLYIIGVSFLAAGFADFPLISYHLAKTNLMTGSHLPLIYSLAMAIDALAALFFGKLYDRIGLKSLLLSTILSSAFAPLAFLFSSRAAVIAGLVCWGLGLGAQESIVKAVITSLTGPEKRATAYGIFNAIFGLAWFAGSALMGFLYQKNINILVIFSVAGELAAAAFFYLLDRQLKRKTI